MYCFTPLPYSPTRFQPLKSVTGALGESLSYLIGLPHTSIVTSSFALITYPCPGTNWKSFALYSSTFCPTTFHEPSYLAIEYIVSLYTSFNFLRRLAAVLYS